MGTGTLTDYTNGQIVEAAHPNAIHAALKGDFVGRDSSGAATPGQNLGTATIPWGTARLTDLILDGSPVEPGLITAQPNRVISGAIRATSDFPDYLRPSGAAASFTVLGATTNLLIDVNGSTATISTDIVKSGLTLAPATNNTCQINDAALTGQDTTRFLGENGTEIVVDNMLSELTSRIGQFVALLNQATNEVFYCRIESATSLRDVRRGFCFDSSGNPVEADVLNNNDTLQLLSLGFIFAEDDGTTIDITYRNPIISGNQPTGPQTGDYWYDLAVKVWKRYSGSSFDQINRTFIGIAALDTSVCSWTRPEYFSKSYSADNTLEVRLDTVDALESVTPDFLVSVDGDQKRFDFGFLRWDASTDFESGVVRTADRDYWLYLTEDGKPIISDKKPYDLQGFLRGWYHPYESWRALAQIYNNSSNEFELVHESDAILNLLWRQNFDKSRVILSNNATVADLDFSAGFFTFDDGTGEAFSPAYTKSLQIVGSWQPGNGGNGLDIGIVAINTWYNCYAIHNPDINDYDVATREFIIGRSDYLFTTTFGSPALPAGYTKKRYIGSIRTGTADILDFLQNDKTFTWDLKIQDVNIAYGTAPIGARTLYPLFTPLGLSCEAIFSAAMFMQSGVTGNTAIVFTNPSQSDQAPTFNNVYSLTMGQQAGGAIQEEVSAQFRNFTDTLSQIGIRSTTPNCAITVSTAGWVDHGLENL